MEEKHVKSVEDAAVESLSDDELSSVAGGDGIMSTHKECPYCHEWYVEMLWPAHVAACELNYEIHRFI